MEAPPRKRRRRGVGFFANNEILSDMNMHWMWFFKHCFDLNYFMNNRFILHVPINGFKHILYCNGVYKLHSTTSKYFTFRCFNQRRRYHQRSKDKKIQSKNPDQILVRYDRDVFCSGVVKVNIADGSILHNKCVLCSCACRKYMKIYFTLIAKKYINSHLRLFFKHLVVRNGDISARAIQLRQSLTNKINDFPISKSDKHDFQQCLPSNDAISNFIKKYVDKHVCTFSDMHDVVENFSSNPNYYCTESAGKVFICAKNSINRLVTSQYILVDGTFPKIKFDGTSNMRHGQLFLIGSLHSKDSHQSVLFTPCVYAFIIQKSVQQYKWVFDTLNEIIQTFHPDLFDTFLQCTWKCDYEQNIRTAIRSKGWQLSSDYFHWTQSIIKQIKKCRLSFFYRQKTIYFGIWYSHKQYDPRFRALVHRLLILPYIPKCFIKITYFSILYQLYDWGQSTSSPAETRKKICRLDSYMKDVWIPDTSATGKSQYSLEDWLICDPYFTTTNNIEGYYSKLKRILGRNIWHAGDIVSFIEQEEFECQSKYIRQDYNARGKELCQKNSKLSLLLSKFDSIKTYFLDNDSCFDDTHRLEFNSIFTEILNVVGYYRQTHSIKSKHKAYVTNFSDYNKDMCINHKSEQDILNCFNYI